VFFGPTVGFLAGWVVGAWVCGWVYQRIRSGLLGCWLGGIGVVYVFGILGLVLMSGLSLSQAALATLVFLPGDILKSLLAAWVVARLQIKHREP
jgi:biotin transport system substrate-specific component